MDLQSRFERLGGPIEPVPTEAIDADLGRGRRAVRRRRTMQAAAGSAFGLAAIVAGVALGGGTAEPDRTPAVAQVAPGGLRLVEYRGPQPKDFTVDKVPDGYFIQNDDETGLTIAPISVQSKPPGIDPSKAPMYDPRDLGGKIGIYLEQKEYRGAVDGEKVTVAGRPAILHPIGPTWQLLLSASPEVYATVQFDVALSREQMLELGAGLHVHPDAIRQAAGATGK
ncbi:MAG: hypothetical protein ABW046_15765 [Actinoplanes sp.]